RVLRFSERRRHANVDRVEGCDCGEVAGGGEAPALHLLSDIAVVEIHDVGSSRVDGLGLGTVQVDTRHPEPGTGELEGQRQPNIAEPDDSAAGLATAYLLAQFMHCAAPYAAGGAWWPWPNSPVPSSTRWGASSALGR